MIVMLCSGYQRNFIYDDNASSTFGPRKSTSRLLPRFQTMYKQKELIQRKLFFTLN